MMYMYSNVVFERSDKVSVVIVLSDRGSLELTGTAASRCVLFLQPVGRFGSVLLPASVTVTLIECRVHLDS